MSNKLEVDVLTDVINSPVLQFPGRRFPGVLVQGDSLKTMADLATEIVERIAVGDSEEARSVADELRGILRSRLDVYEKVLKLNGLALPYSPES
ncbi:MAG: hypothetical protein ABFC77_12315 [Thermoguttaceae bacterium]